MNSTHLYLVVREVYYFTGFGGPPTTLATQPQTVGMLENHNLAVGLNPLEPDARDEVVPHRAFTTRKAAEQAARELNAAAQRDLDPLTFTSDLSYLTNREGNELSQWLLSWQMPAALLHGNDWYDGGYALWYWCWYERIAQLSPTQHQQLVSELDQLHFFRVRAVLWGE